MDPNIIENRDLAERLANYVSTLRALAGRLDESGAVLAFEDASAAQSLDFLHQSLADLEVIIKNWASVAPAGQMPIAGLVCGAKLELSIDAISSSARKDAQVSVGSVDLF